MKMKQKFVAGAAFLSAIAGFSVPAAHADVAATIGVANMYYWRGFDLGGGAALIGDVNVSSNGFIAGVWTSSGDGTLGTEYDLYGGYSGAIDSFTYGLSLVSYNYANPKTSNGEAINPGDYVEIIPTLGYGPFKVTYYDAIEAKVAPLNNKDYSYVTAELIFTKVAFKYGQHMTKDGSGLDGVSYVDATYKYNDKLSFTISKIIDQGNYDAVTKTYAAPKEAHFIVNLTLPIE